MEVSPLELKTSCQGGKHCPDEQSKAQKYQILCHLTGQQEDHATSESQPIRQCFRDRERWQEDGLHWVIPHTWAPQGIVYVGDNRCVEIDIESLKPLTLENDKAKRWCGWGTEGKDSHPGIVLFSLPNDKASQSEPLLTCPEAVLCKLSHSPAFSPVKPLCEASTYQWLSTGWPKEDTSFSFSFISSNWGLSWPFPRSGQHESEVA